MRGICDADDVEGGELKIYDVEITTSTMMEIEATSKNGAEEKARREYVEITHISPQKVYAKKRGEKESDD